MDIDLLSELKERFSLPVYLFHEAEFKNNYSRLVNTMQNEYAKYRPAYSFKTNYTPYICKKIRELGGYAEVVSDMEYELALKTGFPPEMIIYNGPDKVSEIYEALKNDSIVNADSPYEVSMICSYAEENPGTEIHFGLRLNLDLGQDFVSRFGMDEEGVKQALDTVSKTKNARISGIHCHISRCRDIAAWEQRTLYMLDMADRCFDTAPEYIDIGSGMFGDMEPYLADQFNSVPSYEDYASVTARIVNEHYAGLSEEDKPILFTEPGTTLINKYLSLVAVVDDIKTVRGKTLATINCSYHNLGEICVLKSIPIEVIHNAEGEYYEELDLVGYTCLEQDVMYSGYSGRLAVGDYIVFHNVGGYSNVLKPPFIRPNCAMVAVGDDGIMKLIRRQESYDDIFATYVF